MCYIRLPGSYVGKFNWEIQFVRDGYGNDGYGRGEYKEAFNFDVFVNDENLKKFLLSGLKQCRACYECKPGMPIKINDKKYNMCIIKFQNPNENDIDKIIKILENWKNHIDIL